MWLTYIYRQLHTHDIHLHTTAHTCNQCTIHSINNTHATTSPYLSLSLSLS